MNTIEITTNEQPDYSIIWLHGLGASADDFVPVIPELKLPKNAKGIRFIFPNAPMKPVTLNNGYVMPAWYDLYSLDHFRAKEDVIGLRETQQFIETLIEQEIHRGIPSNHIMLAGFSQGCAVSLMVGLQYNQPLGGIIALSGYIPLIDQLKHNIHPANQATPIYLAHGQHDPVVPFELFKESKDTLISAGYHVKACEYPMEHSVCLEEIQDISHFIQNIITPQSNNP